MPTTTAPPATAAERVGRNVAAELTRHGVTQIAAAAELNMHPTSLGQRVTGRVPFRVDELDALALLLGIDVEDFYRRPRPAGDAGQASNAYTVAVLVAGLGLVAASWVGIWAFGHLLLVLADAPRNVTAAALTGLIVLGLLGWAACWAADRVRDARDRARRRKAARFSRVMTLALIEAHGTSPARDTVPSR